MLWGALWGSRCMWAYGAVDWCSCGTVGHCGAVCGTTGAHTGAVGQLVRVRVRALVFVPFGGIFGQNVFPEGPPSPLFRGHTVRLKMSPVPSQAAWC